MSKPTASPSVTGFTPPSGHIVGGTVVTITGQNLSKAYAINFGSAGASNFSADGTKVTATSPNTATAGPVKLTVLFPGGVDIIAGEFTYIAPSITGVSPSSGPMRGGTPVTITGIDLDTATQVNFGGVPGTITSWSATQLVVVSPIGQVSGTVDIQIMLPSGVTPIVTADKFFYIAPTVTGMLPSTGPVTGGTTVTLLGNGLTGATAVIFGVKGGTLLTVTDNAITVKTPEVKDAGAVKVTVSLPSGPVTVPTQFNYYIPLPVNAMFVIDNQTGVPDDLVFVKFLGAEINAGTLAQTYGNAQPLRNGAKTNNTSYSLTEMTAKVPNAPDLSSKLPVFQINDYSGGRIYFSLGAKLQSTTIPAAQNTNDPDFHTVYGYVEPSIFPSLKAGNTNIDASYVDFIGIPFDVSICKRADGKLANPPANNPLKTPKGKTIFNALTADTNVPMDAKVAAKTTVPPTNPTLTISGTARILSPSLYQSSSNPYHDWTSKGGLIDTLKTKATKLSVASYTTLQDHPQIPLGTLFGFSGSPSSDIAALWSVKQSYSLTAEALADLNLNGLNPRIPSLKGVPGIKISGKGSSVGMFDIYITNTDLNAQTGIYGANPSYTVDWIDAPPSATAYLQNGIQNDLSGRVVGDLLSGFNFGWAGCDITVTNQAKATGTTTNIAGTVFDPTTGTLGDMQIGQLSTGQFFYLLSLQPNTADIAKWFGASIQLSQPTWYNNYASDFQALTDCYNMAFTDRLQGQSDPDMFFTPSDDNYVKITLLPGAYSVTVTPIT